MTFYHWLVNDWIVVGFSIQLFNSKFSWLNKKISNNFSFVNCLSVCLGLCVYEKFIKSIIIIKHHHHHQMLIIDVNK